MTANDWTRAIPLPLERADGLPAERLGADGRTLGWLAGIMAQHRHYITVRGDADQRELPERGGAWRPVLSRK
jgi:hypothetical protein